MPREPHSFRARWASAAILGISLFVPAVAEAGELTVNLRETDAGVVVELRGLAAAVEPQQVITSKTGALLFLPDQKSPVRRIASPAKHRLDYVQVGQAGAKVAVRIVQRKRAAGSLGKFMRSEAVPGGLDVFVDDGVPKPAPTVAAVETPAPAEAEAPARDDATQAALARLANVDAKGDANADANAVAAAVAAPAPTPEPDSVAESVADAPRRIHHDTKAAPPDDTTRQAATFEDDAVASPTNAPSGRAIGWIALASLCALGSLAIWRIRKRRTPAQPEPLRIVSRVALGPKQQLVWIVAGDRALLVGATDHGISLISELGRVRTDAVPVEFPEATATVGSTVTDPNAGGKIAAFKQKLRVALGDEIAGKSDLPAHLELLTADPKWTRKDTA